jgi:hypothetical protein
MGIYESELKCGCIYTSCTYDQNDPPFVSKICDLHKLEINKTFNYNLEKFKRRYKANGITKSYFKVKILDIKNNSKKLTLVKMEVEDFDISKLNESSKIYFSEFGEDEEDGVSFKVDENGKTIIIDIFENENIDRS